MSYISQACHWEWRACNKMQMHAPAFIRLCKTKQAAIEGIDHVRQPRQQSDFFLKPCAATNKQQ